MNNNTVGSSTTPIKITIINIASSRSNQPNDTKSTTPTRQIQPSLPNSPYPLSEEHNILHLHSPHTSKPTTHINYNSHNHTNFLYTIIPLCNQFLHPPHHTLSFNPILTLHPFQYHLDQFQLLQVLILQICNSNN